MGESVPTYVDADGDGIATFQGAGKYKFTNLKSIKEDTLPKVDASIAPLLFNNYLAPFKSLSL